MIYYGIGDVLFKEPNVSSKKVFWLLKTVSGELNVSSLEAFVAFYVGDRSGVSVLESLLTFQ